MAVELSNLTNSQELPPGVEIFKPTADDIQPDLVKRFAENLVQGTYNRLEPELDEGNRSEKVENFRMGVRDILGKVAPQSKMIQGLKKKVYPTNTYQDEVNGYIKSITRLIKEGKMLALKKDGKVAAIVGIQKSIKWPDGRDSYEICRASTLPEFGGQGFYKMLATEAENQIRQQNPEAPIVTGTKNPYAKKHLQQVGWTEIPFDYGLSYHQNVDKASLNYQIADKYRRSIENFDILVVKKWIRDKYSIFYFDPKK